MDFGWILNGFWMDFCMDFGWFRMDLGWILDGLGQILMDFGWFSWMDLDRLWMDFAWIFDGFFAWIFLAWI